MTYQPVRYIGEPIEPGFTHPPTLEKTPSCPTYFTWRDRTYYITQSLAEWSDFTRRGRFARNMQPQHARIAASRGSWGVGRFFFRIQVDSGEIFEIYYDRAPKDVDHRKGIWMLVAEFTAVE